MPSQDAPRPIGAQPGTTPRLVQASRLENAAAPPVWIMRQAGRYLPEYQEVRRRHSFVEMCTDPDLATEVSLQPYRRFGFDGVVVFYDILFLAEAMGAPLRFTEEGPTFLHPVRSEAELDALHAPDLASLVPGEGTGAILETLRRLRRELPGDIAVIGFAGAPFTVAAYLVEGGFRRSGEMIRRLLHEDPRLTRRLIDRLSAATADYLLAQVEAGADVVQLFDTWAGVLDAPAYRDLALPATRSVIEAVARAGAPTILYVNGCSHILEDMKESGASVLSIDWRVSLSECRKRLGGAVGLQGNLDPAALFQPPAAVARSVRGILEDRLGDVGYIFNLGHGILPETPVASVESLVETVRGFPSVMAK